MEIIRQTAAKQIQMTRGEERYPPGSSTEWHCCALLPLSMLSMLQNSPQQNYGDDKADRC
jgi:hypothetical protein